AEARAVAAWLTARADQAQPLPAAQVGAVRRFLEQHQALLPVRAVWLAAVGAFRLSHGDVLALTKTRDRLLQRLFEQGMTHDLDMPSFLGYSGISRNERLRAFRTWVLDLPDRVERWTATRQSISEGDLRDTAAYAKLMLSFGLARLGEDHASQRLRTEAKLWLTDPTKPAQDVH